MGVVTDDKREKATSAEIARARMLYVDGADDAIAVDAGAGVSVADDGVWVQAWVWLSNLDEE